MQSSLLLSIAKVVINSLEFCLKEFDFALNKNFCSVLLSISLNLVLVSSDTLQ